MKTVSKIGLAAGTIAILVRLINVKVFTSSMYRLVNKVAEYDRLILKAEKLEQQGDKVEAEATRIVAQNKLEDLALEYKNAVMKSKSAAFGWAIRKRLLTENPLFEDIRKYLEESK